MRHIHSSRLHAAGLQMAGEAGTGVLPGPGQPGFVPAPVGRRASKAPGENSPVSRENCASRGSWRCSGSSFTARRWLSPDFWRD